MHLDQLLTGIECASISTWGRSNSYISDHKYGKHYIRPVRKLNEEARSVLQRAMAQRPVLFTGTCRRDRASRSYVARKRLRGAKNISRLQAKDLGAWELDLLYVSMLVCSLQVRGMCMMHSRQSTLYSLPVVEEGNVNMGWGDGGRARRRLAE